MPHKTTDIKQPQYGHRSQIGVYLQHVSAGAGPGTKATQNTRVDIQEPANKRNLNFTYF